MDVFVLILDNLSLKDLAALQIAFADVESMSRIAKWRSMLRLCDLVTKGMPRIDRTVIDGERGYYKMFREEPFRQMRLQGKAAATRPFLPFYPTTTFDREFRGTLHTPQMALYPTPEQRLQTMYMPIDNSGPPAEVVTVVVTFSSDEEVISLEYDTNDMVVHNGISLDYHKDGRHMTRTVSHKLPLIKVTCRRIDAKVGYELPRDWIQLLGMEAFVNVTFNERLQERRSFYWTGTANMLSFEMRWNLNLTQWSCPADLFDIWRLKSAVQG